MYKHIYIYIYLCIYISIYIYIYLHQGLFSDAPQHRILDMYAAPGAKTSHYAPRPTESLRGGGDAVLRLDVHEERPNL